MNRKNYLLRSYLCFLVRLSSFLSSFSFIWRAFCSITTSWSVVLNLARLIACTSGLIRFIWNFLVTSRKYVLIIFAIKGNNVSSLYLKKAIKTKIKKIGSATTIATYLLTPFLYKTFHTPNHNHIPTAKVINWRIEIEKGQSCTLILNHPPEILRGMNTFCIRTLAKQKIV